MELTLKRLLEQAEFTMLKGRGRGYDQTEVDDFLDRASAMASQVESHMQALEAAAASGGGTGAAPADIEAEVERRVAERLASGPTAPSEEETAEEVRRTIVLAQRTADAAVREAREDAEKLLADARERAETLDTESQARAAALTEESEARAAALTEESQATATAAVADAEAQAAAILADVEAQATRERREARQRLAAEIAELEGIREALRSDVTVIENHVEEQRNQLSSTVSELQRLLEDPAGFRLAPVPVLADPVLPDLSDVDEPEVLPDPVGEAPGGESAVLADAPDPTAAALPEPVPAEDPTDEPPVLSVVIDEPSDVTAPEPEAPVDIPEPEDASPAEAEEIVGEPVDDASEEDDADADPVGEADGKDRSSAAAFGFGDAPAPTERPSTIAQALQFDEVDHEAPEIRQMAAEDSGPATAPVPAVELGIDLTGGGSEPHDDDAFLAELRKAMADDEPLGPRDHEEDDVQREMFDDDRRSWRFGRKR